MTVSLTDLIAQRVAIERQIREAQSARRSEAIGKIRQLMSEHSLTAADLIVKLHTKTSEGVGKKVAPKYRDPLSGSTWSGRGLKPKWLAAALESGKSVADYAI